MNCSSILLTHRYNSSVCAADLQTLPIWNRFGFLSSPVLVYIYLWPGEEAPPHSVWPSGQLRTEQTRISLHVSGPTSSPRGNKTKALIKIRKHISIIIQPSQLRAFPTQQEQKICSSIWFLNKGHRGPVLLLKTSPFPSQCNIPPLTLPPPVTECFTALFRSENIHKAVASGPSTDLPPPSHTNEFMMRRVTRASGATPDANTSPGFRTWSSHSDISVFTNHLVLSVLATWLNARKGLNGQSFVYSVV